MHCVPYRYTNQVILGQVEWTQPRYTVGTTPLNNLACKYQEVCEQLFYAKLLIPHTF